MVRMVSSVLFGCVAFVCIAQVSLGDIASAAEPMLKPGKARLAGNWEMVPHFELDKIQAALVKNSPTGKLTPEAQRIIAQLKAMPKTLKFRLTISGEGKLAMQQVGPGITGKTTLENSLLVIEKEDGADLQVNKISAVPGVNAEKFLMRFTDADHFRWIVALPGMKPDPESGAAYSVTRVK